MTGFGREKFGTTGLTGMQILNGLSKFGKTGQTLTSGGAIADSAKYATYKLSKIENGLQVTVSDKVMAHVVNKVKADTVNKRGIVYYNNLGFSSIPDSSNLLHKAYKVLPGTPIQESNGLWRVITTDPKGNQVERAQPLFIVDGKEVNQKDLKSFEGNVVYLSPETAIFKYGKKGENGALVITTKKK